MIITLDKTYYARVDSPLLGYMGETESRTITSQGYQTEGADRYILRLSYPDGVQYDVDITDGTYTVQASLLRMVGNVKCQILAVKSTGADTYEYVKKSNVFTVTIKPSVGGDTPVPTYEETVAVLDKVLAAEIAADECIAAVETATGAADTASNAAATAVASAETAAKAAETATKARDAATQARISADLAADEAEDSKTAAASAANAAKKSADKAAAAEAATAKTAEDAISEINAALITTTTNLAQAEAARNAAETAATAAEDNKTTAVNAAQTATQAADTANSAADVAVSARDTAVAAQADVTAKAQTVATSAAQVAKDKQTVQAVAESIPAEYSDLSASVDELKGDLDEIDSTVLNEKMSPTETTYYGFTFNTVVGRKYTVKIPKTDGFKVAYLYESDAMQQKFADLTDSTDNRIAKDTEFTATRSSYFIHYQAINANKEYSVKVVSEIGVFEYVNSNTKRLDEVLNTDFSDFATKEELNKSGDFSFTKIVSTTKGNTSNIKGINLRKEMTYSLEVTSDVTVWIQLKVVTAFFGNESFSYNGGLLLGTAIYVEKGKVVKFDNIANNDYVGFSIIPNNTDATITIKTTSGTETAYAFYEHSKDELINDYYSERLSYACLGDSITSEQVTGIGTVVRKKLGLVDSGNYACGYATCSDWHDGDTNTTTQTMDVPQNTNTNDNVLSNQVRRLLQATTNEGETISWAHPIDGKFSIGASVGVGTGTVKAPNIIYIAIGTNDGNNVQNTFIDDSEAVLAQSYSDLTRNSYASALRWAIETLQCAFHNAKIFVASPLQACSTNSWMSFENTKAKRDCTEKIAKACGVKFIDSFFDSGFSYMIAKADNGGGVHPSNEWKENIACFIAGQIESNCWTSKRYLAN